MTGFAGTAVVGLCATFLLGAAPVAAQQWSELTRSRGISGEESLAVRVEYAAGRFEVGAGEEGRLYRVYLRYAENGLQPDVEYEDGRLSIDVEGNSDRVRVSGDEGARLRLLLPRSVPTDLRLEFGAVRANMDLGGIPLTGLRLTTGASESMIRVSEPNRSTIERVQMEVGAARFEARELGNLNASRIDVEAAVGDVTLDFSGEWRNDARVSVSMGLGALSLHFPSEVGVRVEKSGFLAPFNPQGLERRGDVWFSPGFEGAPRKVTVELDATLGSIDLTWGGQPAR